MDKTEKKKIAFFIDSLNQGGAQRVVSILSRQYAELGIPVEIVLYYDQTPFYDIHPAVQITYAERETGSKNLVKNMIWLRRYWKKYADVVISFLAQFNMIALAACFGTGIPVIAADRNDPRHMPKQRSVRAARNILYHLAHRVVVQTRHNQAYFSEKLQKKSEIIYNPIDLQEQKGLALRSEKKPRIVSVARLIKQKNQTMLLDAFARIKEAFPEYTLTVYGEGAFRDELESRIAELGLADCVELPGEVQNVFECIADAELFVLSSDFEGMPNALIEAMCLGLPVISTRVSGATDLIEDGRNGLLTDVGHTAQLADCMKRMLADPRLRQSCAQKAVLLNDRLDVAKITGQWMDCIERVKK